ncbi:MAG TPA: sugar porter family MFS transporter [Bacteroidota bacterium]|nr:sugar porter family MFS transporter [Bacteroidota bacterium]
MNRNLVFATVVSALGSFLFGFDTAVISGTTRFISAYFSLTDTTLGVTVSVALWGTMLGSLAAGRPGDLWGRRAVLAVCGAAYLVSALGCALAESWGILLAFRFLGGIAIGASSVMAPMYIAEIAPARLRGRLVAVAQLNIVIGILVAFFSNYLLVGVGPDNWRWMFGVMALPSAAFFGLLFVVPESPRWLVRVGRNGEARAVLARVGAPQADEELSAISLSLGDEKATPPLFQRKYRFAIWCAVLLPVFGILSGINVIMYYAPMIFERAGASTGAAMLQAVVVGLTNLVFTIAAMFLIDRIGRRPLLMIGAAGMCLAMAGAAVPYFNGSLLGGGALVACVIAFVAFFAFSVGAVIWVFLSEIFPNAVRARGQALATFVDWLVNAVVGLLFPVALTAFGGGAVFLFFSLLELPFFFFVLKMMPETKGKSLEELERFIIREEEQ